MFNVGGVGRGKGNGVQRLVALGKADGGDLGRGIGRSRKDCQDDPGMFDRGLLKFFLDVIDLPLNTTEDPADPLGARFRLGVAGGLVPRNKSIVSLDTDAGVGPHLGFQNSRCRSSSLGEGAATFLEEV